LCGIYASFEEDFGDVAATDKDDRMLIFPDLFIGQLADLGGGD
jgi:hypothetical protein